MKIDLNRELILLVDWIRVYKLLNEVTPLSVDCGRLCGSICCVEWEWVCT